MGCSDVLYTMLNYNNVSTMLPLGTWTTSFLQFSRAALFKAQIWTLSWLCVEGALRDINEERLNTELWESRRPISTQKPQKRPMKAQTNIWIKSCD